MVRILNYREGPPKGHEKLVVRPVRQLPRGFTGATVMLGLRCVWLPFSQIQMANASAPLGNDICVLEKIQSYTTGFCSLLP